MKKRKKKHDSEESSFKEDYNDEGYKQDLINDEDISEVDDFG